MKKKQNKITSELPDWEKLISAQTLFQKNFPEAVLVGGTAAALHVKHRQSLDADYVLPDLKKCFEEILKKVESEAGWQTNRIEPPVLILGQFEGVRTGLRQLMRSKPLETTIVNGLRVPTVAEMLRIKAYLIARRNATRDFIDFVALFDHLGVNKSISALDPLDALYPQPYGASTISQQLVMQLSEPKPWDLSQTDLSNYKCLKTPYTDWNEVRQRARTAGLKIILKKFE